MRIKLNGLMVDDQEKAVKFYTEVLGFKIAQDIPVGEYRWIEIASPEGGDAHVTLEPNVNPAGRTFQKAMFEQGVPFTAFEVDSVQAEFERLKDRDVEFTKEPTDVGMTVIAVFSDTCGNLIQIYEPPKM